MLAVLSTMASSLQASQNNSKQQLAAHLFLRRHEALVLFARQDYPGQPLVLLITPLAVPLSHVCLLQAAGALSRFEHILQEQPRDSIASNGRALCHMYACNLQGAIQVRPCAVSLQSSRTFAHRLSLTAVPGG